MSWGCKWDKLNSHPDRISKKGITELLRDVSESFFFFFLIQPSHHFFIVQLEPDGGLAAMRSQSSSHGTALDRCVCQSGDIF